jgi:TRAP-type C4-dicarboxylate transport system substrate-binding protein
MNALCKLGAPAHIAAVLAMVIGAPAAHAVDLKMADSLPNGHIISDHATKPWIELVSKLSSGKVNISYFPAEQMGKAKDMLMLTQSGVIDIGYVGPSYISEKLPLSAVAELPGGAKNACQSMRAYWTLAKEGGYLYENEFKPNKIRPLFVAALPPYQMVIGSSRQIATIKDVEGLKLRASGGAQDFALHQLNAVPVHMAPPGVYESMDHGTIDGTLFSFVSVESYKLERLVKSATVGANFGTVIVTYSISERKWASLPKDVQEVLKKAGDEITNKACVAFDNREAQTTERLKKLGIKLVSFQNGDKAALEKAYEKVATDWATSLDKRNKPGSAVLKAYREALKGA